MVSMNRLTLIGNAGRDAELRYTADGTASAHFSLAVNNGRWRDNGEWEELEPDWFEVSAWRERAERVAGEWGVSKGDTVLVEGRVRLHRWQRDDGTEGVALDVTADRVSVVKRVDADGNEGGTPAPRPQQPPQRPQQAQRAPQGPLRRPQQQARGGYQQQRGRR